MLLPKTVFYLKGYTPVDFVIKNTPMYMYRWRKFICTGRDWTFNGMLVYDVKTENYLHFSTNFKRKKYSMVAQW